MVLMAMGGLDVQAQGRPAQGAPAALSDVEGELEVQVEDSATGARIKHVVHTSTGEHVPLRFTGRPPNLLTGSRVRARGTLSNGTLMLTSDASVQTATLASLYTFGVQPTLVILINFQDNPSQPYTVASAQDVTFNQTSAYYLENSYGQTSLSGTTVGWFTLPVNSTVCDTSLWTTLADQAATNAGVNLSSYGRRIYGFPATSACSFWGLGTVGGGSPASPSRLWVNGMFSLRVVAHEMGHNYGDFHSHANLCDTTGCTFDEYGDDRDTMGALTAHFNAFQKERLGWLNYGTSPSIVTVTQNSNIWLDAYETLSNGAPKALKVLKSLDPVTGAKTWYYAEARTVRGFDDTLTAGVVLHTASDADPNSSNEIDHDLQGTALQGLLAVGRTFSDAATGLSMTTISADATGALVNVSVTPVACTRANPGLVMSPAQTPSLMAGSAFSYTVAVTNNDSSGCTAGVFNLGTVLPAGWSYLFGSPTLTINAGSNASTTLKITSASAAANGSYAIVTKATGTADPAKAGSGSAMYIVSAPVCTGGSPTVSLSPGQSSWLKPGSTFTYTLSVGNTDTAGCASATFNMTAGVPGGWTATLAKSSLVVAPGSSASTTLNVTSPASATNGSYSVSTVATKSVTGQVASASATYVVLSSLTMQTSTTQTSYSRNESAVIIAKVLAGSAPVAGATVTFKVTKSNGKVVTGQVVTNSSGSATYTLSLSKKDPTGSYQVNTAVSLNGISGSGAASFTVK